MTRYFEDLRPGQVFALGSRTVTAEEIVAFATAFDPQPFHVDADAARETSFGGLVASGWHTCALWMRMYADVVLADADSRGSPGMEEIRWRLPVRPGDVLTGSLEIGETRASERDPTRGTAMILGTLANQDGAVVLTMRGRGMFGRRPA